MHFSLYDAMYGSWVVDVLHRCDDRMTLVELCDALKSTYGIDEEEEVLKNVMEMCQGGSIRSKMVGTCTMVWLDEDKKESTVFFGRIPLWLRQDDTLQHVNKKQSMWVRDELGKWERIATHEKYVFHTDVDRKRQLLRTLQEAKMNVHDENMRVKMDRKIESLRNEISRTSKGPPNGGVIMGDVDLASVQGVGMVFVKVVCMGPMVVPVVTIMGGVAAACVPYVMPNGRLLNDGIQQYHDRLQRALPHRRLGQAMALCRSVRDEKIRAAGRRCHVYSACMALSREWVQFLCDELSVV